MLADSRNICDHDFYQKTPGGPLIIKFYIIKILELHKNIKIKIQNSTEVRFVLLVAFSSSPDLILSINRDGK